MYYEPFSFVLNFTLQKCFSIIYKIECFHSHLTKLCSCLCRFIFKFGGEISKDWSPTCNENLDRRRRKKKKKLTWQFSLAIIHMLLWCEWSLVDTPLYLLVRLVLASCVLQNIYLLKLLFSLIWFMIFQHQSDNKILNF